MRAIIQLLRPSQWIKNMFVFLPLFFDKHLGDFDCLITALTVFVAYSFAASSIYCFNDIWDIEQDKKHPLKSQRPVASGAVSKQVAYSLTALLLILSVLITSLFLSKECLYTLTFYFLLNLLYCIRLKQIVLLDVFIIAIGFVLRVLIGGQATGIWISHWIILMTFLLALFLALAKRRDDVVIYEEKRLETRKNIKYYNLDFMNQVISIIASVIIVCYIMYSVSEEVIERMGTSYLYITSIFVLAGIIRYLQITIVNVKSGSPTKVLMTDSFTQICLVGWLITFFLILYYDKLTLFLRRVLV